MNVVRAKAGVDIQMKSIFPSYEAIRSRLSIIISGEEYPNTMGYSPVPGLYLTFIAKAKNDDKFSLCLPNDFSEIYGMDASQITTDVLNNLFKDKRPVLNLQATKIGNESITMGARLGCVNDPYGAALMFTPGFADTISTVTEWDTFYIVPESAEYVVLIPDKILGADFKELGMSEQLLEMLHIRAKRNAVLADRLYYYDGEQITEIKEETV